MRAIVDEPAPDAHRRRNAREARAGLTLDRRQALVARVLEERRSEEHGDDACAQQRRFVDVAVLGEECGARLRRQRAPHELEVERRIAAAEVDPVDDAADATAVDEDVAEVQVPVTDRARLRRRQRPRLLEHGVRRGAAPARSLRASASLSRIIGTRTCMSARRVSSRAGARRAAASTSRECSIAENARRARGASVSREVAGRLAQLDPGQQTRPEEGPRKRIRRNADVLRHGDRDRQQRRKLGKQLDLDRKPGQRRPRARGKRNTHSSPTTKTVLSQPAPSKPHAAGRERGKLLRDEPPRQRRSPPRSRDPTAARDADYVSTLQAWPAAEIPRGS